MSTRLSFFGWLSASLVVTAALWSCGGNVVVDTPAGGAGTGATGGAGTGATGGTGGTIQSCPTAQPQPCELILGCLCIDGTPQTGGCSNGFFTCPEVCCGHGGFK